MTFHEAINTGLIARGLLPMDGDCTCAACELSGLDREEIADTDVWPASFLARLKAEYGGPVCVGCADSAVVCAHCDGLLANPEHQDGVGNYICTSCDDEDDWTAQERHGWEQV